MGFVRVKANQKLIRNLLFFVGLIFLTFWFIFKDQDMEEVYRVINSADKKYILLGLSIMMTTFLIESYNVKAVLKTLGEKNISIFSALKYTFIGFFFSAITPAATGGQPVEVYYMTKDKISGGNATMALLIQLCGYQISTISIGLICAALNPHLLSDGLGWFFLLGITINGFALALMLMCVFSRRLTEKIVNILMKILSFFKAKNVELRKKAILEGMEKYKEGSVFVKNHKLDFFKAIFRVFIQITLYYSVPYCVYRAFGLNSYSFLQIFPMQAVLYTIVSGLPLPGAIGVSETAFLKIFGVAFGTSLLSGAVLLNRVISFYFFIIVSLSVVIVNAIKKKDVVSEIDEGVTAYENEVEKLAKA